MVSGWSEHGYTQWRPVLRMTNILPDPHQTGVPGKRCMSTPQPLTTVAPQCWPQLPPSSSPSPKLGLTSSVPTFPLSHSAFSLLLHAQLEIPVLWAEKVRELLPNTYCLEAVWVLAFYKYHSLEVFGGNTKINILIQWLLIPPKQMWTSCILKCKIQQHSGSVTVLNIPSNIFNHFTYRWIKDFSPLKVFLEIDLMLLFSMNL